MASEGITRAAPSVEDGDRQGTREKLLETAGRIFADRGVEGATGKAICEAAGTNTAAINYHFGGMDGLYEAVLLGARDRIVASDALAAVMASAEPAEARLRAVMRLVAQALLHTEQRAWALRLVSREVMAPSPVGARVLLATAQARIAAMKRLLAEILELPEEHPAVSRCCISISAPFQLLILAERAMVKRVYPDVDLSPAGVDTLADHFVRFALAGLKATAEAERGPRA